MSSLRSDVKKIVHELVHRHGCEARVSTSGHWRVSRKGHGTVTMAASPSDQRAVTNIRKDVTKYLGIKL